jgi:hypothetical protein
MSSAEGLCREDQRWREASQWSRLAGGRMWRCFRSDPKTCPADCGSRTALEEYRSAETTADSLDPNQPRWLMGRSIEVGVHWET